MCARCKGLHAKCSVDPPTESEADGSGSVTREQMEAWVGPILERHTEKILRKVGCLSIKIQRALGLEEEWTTTEEETEEDEEKDGETDEEEEEEDEESSGMLEKVRGKQRAKE